MTYRTKCPKCEKEIKGCLSWRRWRPYCEKCFNEIAKEVLKGEKDEKNKK